MVIKIVKIRGHNGIKGNERVDREARQAAKEIVDDKIKAPACVSVADAYKISAEIAKRSWQRRWDSDSKARYTYELIPEVGTRICWPRKRDIGVSYCRMLLHDTMLNDDAFRTGVAVTPLCSCNVENETVKHFLFDCISTTGKQEVSYLTLLTTFGRLFLPEALFRVKNI